MQDYKRTCSVIAMLEKLDWPLLLFKWKKARLNTLYKFSHGLLQIDSKCVPTTGNQKKSHCQTNSCFFDVPNYRTLY